MHPPGPFHFKEMEELSSNHRFTKNGRDLQEFIGSTKDHTSWAKDQINQLTLKGDIDYQVVTEYNNPHNPKYTYWFSEAAAHLVAVNAGPKIKHPEKAQEIKANIAMKSMTLDEVFRNPRAGAELLLQMAAREEELMAMKSTIELQAPKVEAYDDLMDAAGNHTFQETAGILNIQGMGRNNLIALLKERRVLMANRVPFRRFIEAGYFICRERPIMIGDVEKVNIQTFVTPKGLDWIRKILKA